MSVFDARNQVSATLTGNFGVNSVCLNHSGAIRVYSDHKPTPAVVELVAKLARGYAWEIILGGRVFLAGKGK